MHNIRRSIAVVTIAAAAAIGSACGGSDSTGPAPSAKDTVAGNFALNKVNTSVLPATIASDPGNYSLEITAGTAVLQTNGQFVMTMTSKETVAGHASTYIDSTSGTWTQLTGAITFTMVPGSAVSAATWDGTSLSIVQDGDTYVFKKH